LSGQDFRKERMRRGILASRDELQSLGERIGDRPFDRIFDVLQRRCSLILDSGPVTEQQWRLLWHQGRWDSATVAARTAQGRILDLAIASHIDPNSAFRSRAVEEIRSLVHWSTWVDPCHNGLSVDLCTAEAAVAVALGLDWLWEDLSQADRDSMVSALKSKAIVPFKAAVKDKAWWYTCYHNWNAVVNSGCGLAALALSDTDEDAAEAYQLARTGLRRFFDALGPEGGWDEGTGYWGYAMRYVLLLAEASSRVLDDRSLLHERGMEVTGLFPVYFTPNGHSASFGDVPTVPVYGAFYNLVRHFGLPQLAWWLDTYTFTHDVSMTGWSRAGLAMLFRPADIETPKKVDLEPVKVFNQIGWAAVADAWPRPNMYVAAKTGDLAANHSQRDMNSIQLQVDGEMILTDLGCPSFTAEYLSDGRDDYYEVQAQAHNTIVVGEDDHMIDAQGRILDSGHDRMSRWIVCDSGHACGENTQFVRHVVMVVDPATQAGRFVLVLDELNNAVPERVSLYWHTQGQIELEPGAMAGTLTGQRAVVPFALASTVKASAQTHTAHVQGNVEDHFICMSAGVMDKALFASVFARGAGPIDLTVEEDLDGIVTVVSKDVRVCFRPEAGRLALQTVSMD
jgi:heparinase II/III-like protein